MWIPEHCHVIEFNNFPDYKGPIRNVFMNAWWAKTPTSAAGKYWIVEPSKRSKEQFYFTNMRVSVMEVIKILGYIKVVKGESHHDYPEEAHVFTD